MHFSNSFFTWGMWRLPLGKKKIKFVLQLQRVTVGKLDPSQLFTQKTLKNRGDGWIQSVHTQPDFLWASCWNKPIWLNGIQLWRVQSILIPPSACTLCSDDKFQSVAWGIYFHSTSLLPRLRKKASSPSLPVTLEVLHLLYIWWNSMQQWKFTRCCRKKQGKVKAQPRNKKWVLFACTFIDFWQPCYFQGQQKGKEFQSLNGWVIYCPLLFN